MFPGHIYDTRPISFGAFLARTKAISSHHFSHGMSTFQRGLPQPSFPFSPWLPRGVLRSLHPFQSRDMFIREPPKAQQHAWNSLTYGPRAFISLSPYVEYQLGAVSLIQTFSQIYWRGASILHAVRQLSFTWKYITHGGLMMSQSTFPFHKPLMYPTRNPFNICN